MQQYIIGREGNQDFVIDDSCTRVSKKHLKLLVTDNGEWWIEDLDSTNGTYIQDENGDYQRIGKKQITEFTRIALGGDKAGCFVFTAHHVLEPYSSEPSKDADYYSAEFCHMLKNYNSLKEKKETIERKIRRNNRLKAFPAVIVSLVGLPAFFIWHNVYIDITYVFTQMATLIPFIIDNLSSKKDELARIEESIKKISVCPRCNHHIDEDNLRQQYCPTCKAHS